MPAWIPCSFRSFLEFLAADGLIYFCHQRSFPRYWLTFYLDAEIIVSVGMTMPQVISPIERVPAHTGNRIPLNRMMWRYRRHMLLQFLPALCISFSSSCFRGIEGCLFHHVEIIKNTKNRMVRWHLLFNQVWHDQTLCLAKKLFHKKQRHLWSWNRIVIRKILLYHNV